jgi:NAD(P)H-flavin reductase
VNNEINDFQMTPVKITFNFKAQIAKNSFILRFLLPDNDKPLGINICQNVMLESEVPELGKMKKPFQPISSDTDTGFIDFLVKVYPKKETNLEYGAFSNHLINLEVNRPAN